MALAATVAAAGVYARSEHLRRRTWPKAPVAISASADPTAPARGARLAILYGCHDCHGQDLTGRLFHDEPAVARISGANLTLAVGGQSDADLARAIRTGVAADGRGLFVMPSSALATLTDVETADLIAYLRTFRPAGKRRTTLQPGPIGRLGLALGKFRSEPQLLAERRPQALAAGSQHEKGRALSRMCMECHGSALEGSTTVGSPNLTMAASYTLPDFTRFMRTGIAAGDRRLPLMSPTAQARFAHLTDEEIAALYGYLAARAQRIEELTALSSK
jgi:mono/diheme cytochrome c family protein